MGLGVMSAFRRCLTQHQVLQCCAVLQFYQVHLLVYTIHLASFGGVFYCTSNLSPTLLIPLMVLGFIMWLIL